MTMDEETTERCTLLKIDLKKAQERIKSARQCMDFQNIKCNNKDCKNEFCPLNKIWGLP